MKIICPEKDKQVFDDLESIEFFIRRSVHNLGRKILEKLLNMDVEDSSKNIEECEDGHRAKLIEVREKRLLTVLGEIKLKRNYYYDAKCKIGWCPKDRQLGIEGCSFSPGVRRMMGRVGSSRPFALSEEDILELAGLKVNAKAIERNCHELGKEAEDFVKQIQFEKLEHLSCLPTRQACGENITKDIMYISMDGTGVPIVKAETEGHRGKAEDGKAKTREAKLGCVFMQTTLDESNRPVRQEESTTYVGAIESAEDFSKRIYSEAQRRGVERNKKVCVLGDGALWIWNIAADYFPDAIQIIDLFHAREHYWDCARMVFADNIKRMQQWTEQRKEDLDNGNVEAVIRAIKRLHPKNEEARKICKSSIRYFEQNKNRMRYDKFRSQGLFVGSGVIEAGCRTVIGQRLKQSGMHWTVSGANSIIALRCILKGYLWEDFWEYKAAA